MLWQVEHWDCDWSSSIMDVTPRPAPELAIMFDHCVRWGPHLLWEYSSQIFHSDFCHLSFSGVIDRRKTDKKIRTNNQKNRSEQQKVEDRPWSVTSSHGFQHGPCGSLVIKNEGNPSRLSCATPDLQDRTAPCLQNIISISRIRETIGTMNRKEQCGNYWEGYRVNICFATNCLLILVLSVCPSPHRSLLLNFAEKA